MKNSSVLEKYPSYEVVIGIEVHVQLLTKSKIFCSCANQAHAEANTNICPVCTGHPGVLPVLNKKVVDHAILMGLATNCEIAGVSQFDRKHYFYPDLPKNYQITQQNIPICSEGYVPIRLEDGSTKNIRIKRIHIEEDAGKNMHAGKESFVDLNRAGTPLLETVTYPDISSAYEARAYLKMLHSIVQYIHVGTANMQDGAFRADTNISVRKRGAQEYGTKCELKNINSFKFIGDAIEYEIERQIDLIESGGKVRQETRLWDSKNRCTVTMRVKEEAADYKFFPDPDLPLVEVSDVWIDRIKAELPELPYQKFDRFCAQMSLTPYEAEILVEDAELAHYFERAYAIYPSKSIVNWIIRDIIGYLNEHKVSLAICKVTPEKLATIVKLLETNVINNRAAREVFEIVASQGGEPEAIVKERGLEQMGSSAELESIVKEIVALNPSEAADYKAGNERLMGFFVGQAMKKSGGKANPKMIQEILKKLL